MNSEPRGGNVLVVADALDVGRRLCESIAAAGERPMLVAGPERALLERGTDETVDLVVTEVDPGDPVSRRLLERLLGRDLLCGVPQLHRIADPRLREHAASLTRDPATVFAGALGLDDGFRNEVRLSVEIGRLRRGLLRAAIRDDATGAHNRRFCIMRLEQEFSRARRHRSALSLALIEIDQAQALSDRYGLDSTDRALRQIHTVVRGHLRKEDVSARWGNATLAAILTGSPHRGAAVFASKVRGETEAMRIPTDDGALRVAVSAGISSFDPKRAPAGAVELVTGAEEALGEAQRRGGNRVHIDKSVLRRERRLAVIADPDPELLDLAEDLLSMDDFRVVRVECEATLIETLRHRRPDVLILDLQRVAQGEPAALIEQIRAMFPDAPVPIVGLASLPVPDERGSRVAVDRYITKPFSVSVLRSVARDLLEQHRRSRPPTQSV